ncbi:MAG TPA: amino acid deaminase [Terracidiphilus sp.]|jgi:D-serine dehydratase|nr:amino acid deaminase [Terracidiphilus sp.]
MDKILAVRAANPVTISPLHKGLGPMDGPLAASEIAARGWNLLNEDLSLPVAVLYQDRLNHNLHWMQQFIDAYGLRLAPHGKTTMAPRLFQMQLDAGAWGITLATAHQTQAAYRHGVRRVLMANQLVGRQNMSLIAQMIQDPGFSYYCLVDSADGVNLLGEFFRQRGLRLEVLLELGVEGGRSGVRDEAQLESVLEALSRWPDSLALAGLEVYEGILSDEAAVRGFLERAVGVARRLAKGKRFQHAPFLLSGAGSVWYDVVAEVFAAAGFGPDAEIVLRPGCYLTHDVGAYREAQARILERNPVARRTQAGLTPALHLWAYVHSVPEPGRAIVGLGKRDAAFDSGLPTPALCFRPGQAQPATPIPVPAHWALSKMMDQHAYLDIAPGDSIRPGDMIGFDISHPCLTFDKWRVLPVLDGRYQVVDLVETFF